MTIFWYSLRNLNLFTIIFHAQLVPSSSLTMWAFAWWFSSFDESNIMFTSGGISSLSWLRTWHNVAFKLTKTFTMLLFLWSIFLYLDFKYYSWYLWTLFLCFSISSCVALMCSIASTNILLFLYDTSRIRKITFVFLHLTLVFWGAISVVGCFPTANVDG